MDKIKFQTVPACILSFFAFWGTNAQKTTVKDTIATRLNEITISPLHLNDSLMNAPSAIGILSPADITRNNTADISVPLNTVSGVFMQSGGYNTNRISIRGIGARTPYGTNKIRAFYGAIPLTSGDSETTIEDIDLENIVQIEIIKGPLSSVYGAGLGGAILIGPKLASAHGNTASIGTMHGSFGLLKNTATYSYSNESSNLNVSYHKLASDGWRENSSYTREGVTIAGELLRRPNNKLTYFGNYTFLKAFIPSSINRQAFENDPKSAAPTWLAAKGFERYDSYLIGFAYDFNLSEKLQNSTSVFFNHKESDEPRPFDILLQNTTGYGARTQFTGFADTQKRVRVLVGGEYFRDGFKGRTHENLYQQNNGMGSLQGNLLAKSIQTRNFYNGFAQLRYSISKTFEIQAGLNINKTHFELQHRFPDASGQKYSYKAIWSPQLSVLYKPSATQTFYASASHGYSLPSVEETLTAGGSINPDIKPESGYNFEIGQKSWLAGKKLYLEISAYRMQIKDLLVAQRIGDDQYVGVNAGETIHQGIELSAAHHNDFGLFSIASYLAASFGDYAFKEFNTGQADYSGNNLTGVPANKANAGITLKRNGIYFSADYQFTDAFPMTDTNDLYSDSYQLVNLKLGWRFAMTPKILAHFSCGINNAANQKYASMILVNATAPPNTAPRFYYPGLRENYYISFSAKHSF